jgi:FkbM family methyltransferase
MVDLKGEFLRLYDNYAANARPLKNYQEIWFIGDISSSFALRAYVLAKSLDNFKGIIVASISKEKRIRISTIIGGDGYWEFLNYEEVIERANKKKLLVVDFNDTKSGRMFPQYLANHGVEICDYIKLMNDLEISHTYMAVNKEREYYLDNLDNFIILINKISDELSKNTVIARLKAFISLNRMWLLDVAQGYQRFNITGNSFNALNISEDEVYVDIGAAHGDTVAEFFNVSLGRYSEIHAFEPDSVNFNSLKKICAVLPNANCYNLGLSDEAGALTFLENVNNRFGSRFELLNTNENNVNVVRLDDAVPYATLIKIDVEGFESRVLKGAARIIKEYGPSMHVAGYHYPQDLISIIEVVEDIRHYKNIAIRHCDGSLYDTNILFSNRQKFY